MKIKNSNETKPTNNDKADVKVAVLTIDYDWIKPNIKALIQGSVLFTVEVTGGITSRLRLFLLYLTN